MNLAYFGSIEAKRWRIRDESVHTPNVVLLRFSERESESSAYAWIEWVWMRFDVINFYSTSMEWCDYFFACSHIIEFQWTFSLSKIDEMMTLHTWRHWWLLLKWMLNQLTLKWFPAKWNQMIWFWSVNVRRLDVIGIVKWLKRKRWFWFFILLKNNLMRANLSHAKIGSWISYGQLKRS